MIFVNSMSDLFHEEVPDNYIMNVAEVMVRANWHTYQVLTKRSKRMTSLLQDKLRFAADAQHIWWGVSVDTRAYGLPRVLDLQASSASVKFLSIEPLLEDIGNIELREIHWVIVGGESGPGARPLKREWATSIRDQCEAQGIPFFFKQWGGVRKKTAGRLLDGRTHDGFPARSTNPVSPRELCLAWAREVLQKNAHFSQPHSELLPIVA
jgi:protein gp37